MVTLDVGFMLDQNDLLGGKHPELSPGVRCDARNSVNNDLEHMSTMSTKYAKRCPEMQSIPSNCPQ